MVKRFCFMKLLILFPLLFFIGCFGYPKNVENIQYIENIYQAKHVFLIGLDGMGAYPFKHPELLDMPKLGTVIREGSYTFDALAVMPSSSLPNWSSMFMGAGPEVHKYNSNDDYPRVLTFPSIFSILKNQQPDYKVAFFYEWNGLVRLVPRNIDKIEKISNSYYLDIPKIVDYIEKEKPNFTTIVFDVLDELGHEIGWYTPGFYQKLNEMDIYIEEILRAIENAGIWDDSVIFVSADHGGTDTDHGRDTKQDREIPIIIMGKNIRSGHRIAGASNIYDIAPTIAHIFGLRIPSEWQGKVLDVFIEN